ncbi:LysM peptidoglycan-binding domain-containing protein [Alkaliphilus crotonatoxidans]
MTYYYSYPYPYSVTTQQQLPPVPDCPGGTIYTVRPGDTMFRIANEFTISLQSLLIANPQVRNPNILYPGQELCIPAIVTPPPPVPFCTEGTIYTIQRGDTLFSIARNYGITVQQMIQANPQIADPNLVQVGQRVCIPVILKQQATGISKIDLEPLRQDKITGVALLDSSELTLWIAVFGLPAPAEINPDYCTYRAWLVKDSQSYLPIELKFSGEPGIEVAYEKFNSNFEGYTQILVTAEKTLNPKEPTGSRLLQGSLGISQQRQ